MRLLEHSRPHGASTGGSLSGSRLLWPVLSELGINISSASPALHRLWLSCAGCFWLQLNHLSKWGVHLRERLHHLDKITALGAEENAPSLALGPCLLVPVLSGDVFLCFFYSRTNKTQCSFIGLVSVTLWALEATQAPSLGRNNHFQLLFASFILLKLFCVLPHLFVEHFLIFLSINSFIYTFSDQEERLRKFHLGGWKSQQLRFYLWPSTQRLLFYFFYIS